MGRTRSIRSDLDKGATRSEELIAGGGALAERSGRRASVGNLSCEGEGEGEVGGVMSATGGVSERRLVRAA